MDEDNKKSYHHATITISALIFDYLSYLPLVYVVLYCFMLLSVIFVDTPLEEVFIRSLRFTLGDNREYIILNGGDIMRAFFIWWAVFGTVLELLKKFFRLNLKWSPVVLMTIAVVGTIALIVKAKNLFVPITFFGMFLVCLWLYSVLARAAGRVRDFGKDLGSSLK